MSTYVFGAHTYLWTDRWSDDRVDLLDRVRELGLGIFEVAVGDDVVFTPRRTRERAERLGLKLTAGPGGLWPMDCDISHDDADVRRRGMEWHRRIVDLASELGAVAYTGAIYGHPGRVMRRPPPRDELPRTAENLHGLAEYAARRGVLLAVEPMSRFRTHLVNTPEQALRLVETAEHPNLRILLDTYHMVTEVRDYAGAVRRVGPRLFGIHACENDRGAPGGGIVPWAALAGAMNALGGEYVVMFETYNSGIDGFAVSRGLFHDACPDGDEFVRRGMDFLRGYFTPCDQPAGERKQAAWN